MNADDSLPSVGGSIADTPDARRIRDDMRDADELPVFQRRHADASEDGRHRKRSVAARVRHGDEHGRRQRRLRLVGDRARGRRGRRLRVSLHNVGSSFRIILMRVRNGRVRRNRRMRGHVRMRRRGRWGRRRDLWGLGKRRGQKLRRRGCYGGGGGSNNDDPRGRSRNRHVRGSRGRRDRNRSGLGDGYGYSRK